MFLGDQRMFLAIYLWLVAGSVGSFMLWRRKSDKYAPFTLGAFILGAAFGGLTLLAWLGSIALDNFQVLEKILAIELIPAEKKRPSQAQDDED